MNNPTVLHFGKDVVNDLGTTAGLYGRRVLLVYGRGSVKQTGLYQQVMCQLGKIRAEVFEYSGIRPNPTIDDVDSASALGRAKGVEVIVAVGGGSVIDTAKAIAITIPVLHSGWEFFAGRAKPAAAVPVIAVLTLAATGSEMNMFAVIQNNRSKNKSGYGHRLMYPAHSFLDPANTVTVSREYTAYGIVDLVAHALESYFGAGDASLSDKIVFAIVKEAMEAGPPLLEDLRDIGLRGRIMYAATLALNGITGYGRVSGDWSVHSIGHVLSVLYDVPHGASLSIAYPAWLKYYRGLLSDRIALLGRNLFGTADVEDTIGRLEDFFRGLGSPVRFSEIGLNGESTAQILEHMQKTRVSGNHIKITAEDCAGLVSLMS